MKAFTAGISLIVLIGVSVSANATLIDRGTGMIYDSDQDITWYDYTFSKPTWQEAVNWAGNLEVVSDNNVYDDYYDQNDEEDSALFAQGRFIVHARGMKEHTFHEI